MTSYITMDIDHILDPADGPSPDFAYCLELVDAMNSNQDQFIKKNPYSL